MKQYQISNEDLEQAKKWSSFNGNKYTYYDATKNKIIGALGEIYYQKEYPDSKRISQNDKEADFINNGKRIDIKTQIRKGNVNTNFDVKIIAHQKNFNVDSYYFYWFDELGQIIYELGEISKQDFFNNAIEIKDGQIFPGTNSIVKEGVFLLKIEKLKQIQFNDQKNRQES